MGLLAADVPWWWLGGLVGTLLVVTFSAVMMPGMLFGDGKAQQVKQRAAEVESEEEKRKANKKKQDSPGRLEDEPWFPQVEIKEWKDAGQLPGCPWCFDSCDTVEDVIKNVWRTPLHTGLQQALGALLQRVKNVRVARVHDRMADQTYFSIVYRLNSGAELFGGQPLDLSVGLDLEGISEPGLRRRHGISGVSAPGHHSLGLENGLPCLAPFYRIHDGFGCLLSTQHLPILLAHPSDSIHGSSFYVYPTRCMETVSGSNYLVKFARVDKSCVAAADGREEHPHVVYAETNGELTQDDESPVDFVADTVCNIAGQKVVPDSYGYHAYGGITAMTGGGAPY